MERSRIKRIPSLISLFCIQPQWHGCICLMLYQGRFGVWASGLCFLFSKKGSLLYHMVICIGVLVYTLATQKTIISYKGSLYHGFIAIT